MQATSALLEAGADVNARAGLGYSPLHMAATNSAEVVEALLKAGADVNAKSNAGETALSLAEKGNQATTVALILEHGGER